MKERLLFIGTALALFSYGCGSADSGGATTPVDNQAAETAASTAVEATQMLNDVKSAPESGSALGAVSNLYGQLSVVASAGAPGLTSISPAEGPAPKAGLDTCVSATNNLVTYNSCDLASTNIDGTIGINGDTIACDLAVNSGLSGTAVGFTMVGSLTVTTTLVNGSMSYDTNISGFDLPGGVGGVRLEASFDNVGLDAMGCPTSGSLTVRQNVAGGIGYDFGAVRAEFGPVCGEVQLYN